MVLAGCREHISSETFRMLTRRLERRAACFSEIECRCEIVLVIRAEATLRALWKPDLFDSFTPA